MLLEASKIVINILEPKGTVTTVTTVTNWIQTLLHGNPPGHSNVLTAAVTAPLPLCLRFKAIQIPSSIYCGISLVKTWNVILHAPTSWKFANNVAGQVPQHSAASIQHRHDFSLRERIILINIWFAWFHTKQCQSLLQESNLVSCVSEGFLMETAT